MTAILIDEPFAGALELPPVGVLTPPAVVLAPPPLLLLLLLQPATASTAAVRAAVVIIVVRLFDRTRVIRVSRFRIALGSDYRMDDVRRTRQRSGAFETAAPEREAAAYPDSQKLDRLARLNI